MSLRGRTALIVAGAGMNLSTYGIGVWGDSVLLSSGSFVGPALAALSDTYLLFSALGLFGALIARVVIAVASGASNHRYLACGLGPMAMAAALFISGVWNTSGLLVALAAFCVGWSFACQSLFWVTSISFEPKQMRTIFPLELACAAAFNGLLVIGFMDNQGLFLGLCIALSAAASVALVRLDQKCEQPKMVPVAGFFESRYVPAFRTFAEVLFCVAALQTIAPTLNYMGFLGDLSPIEQQLVVAGAKLAAAVALVAILRFSKAPLLSVQVFKVVTPVLILLLFAVPFAPAPYLLGLLAAGSCLHFVVMNSLFCIDAIAIAQRHRLVFEAFYGAGYLLLMGFCAVLEKVMPQLLAAGSSAELLLVFGVFFSVYVLSMVLVLVRRRRRDEDGGALPSDRFVPDADTRRDASATLSEAEPSSGIAITEDAPAPLPIAERVGIVQRKFGLSDREAEIVLLITRGRNVPAIAEELVISQNTVRTHIKRIYRACGAHARQELIELCETAETEEDSLSQD